MKRLASSPLRQPRFLRLWIGLLISQIGDQFTLIALLWFVLKLTGSQWAVGTTILAFALPRAISAPFWGRLLDKHVPQTVMVIDNIARAVVIAAIPIVYWMGITNIEVIIGLSFLAGLFAPATEIGVRVLMPRLVPDAELEQANGLIFSTQQLAVLFGPALSGWITATWGAPIALLIDAFTFLAMIVALLTLGPVAPIASVLHEQKPSFWAGFRLVFAHGTVRVLTILLFVLALSYYPLEPALPLYVERVLVANADAYGLIWSGFGIGAALSILLIAPLSRSRRPGIVAALIAIGWGVAILPAAIAPNLNLAIACFAFGGLAWGPYIPLESTVLQRIIPASQHGAVFGARSSLISLTGPIGVVVGSGLLQILPANAVIGISSAAVLLAGVFALLSRDLRAVRRA